jgi:hypothetical protein
MGISVSISGIEGLKKYLSNYDKVLTQGLADEIKASAINIEKNAKRLAPVNFGNLRRSIHFVRIDKLTYNVEASAKYAPYLEFGTGGKVSIPVGYAGYAAQFKGQKGGTYYEFLMAIVDWIKKKGIKGGVYSTKTKRRLGNKAQKFNEDVKLAERIAYSILKKGIRAQPFLIPSFETETPKIFLRIKTLLNAQS